MKADQDFPKRFDLKEIKFPDQIRYIHKIEKKKKHSTGISIFEYKNK